LRRERQPDSIAEIESQRKEKASEGVEKATLSEDEADSKGDQGRKKGEGRWWIDK
jgi:hypothetical protein